MKALKGNLGDLALIALAVFVAVLVAWIVSNL